MYKWDFFMKCWILFGFVFVFSLSIYCISRWFFCSYIDISSKSSVSLCFGKNWNFYRSHNVDFFKLFFLSCILATTTKETPVNWTKHKLLCLTRSPWMHSRARQPVLCCDKVTSLLKAQWNPRWQTVDLFRGQRHPSESPPWW